MGSGVILPPAQIAAGALGSGVTLGPGTLGSGVIIPAAQVGGGVLGSGVTLAPGTLGSGVLIPAAQVSAGTLGSGVTLAAGTLGSGVLIPAAQVTSGTLGSGVALPNHPTTAGTSQSAGNLNGNCGAGAAISGNDQAGAITIGTGPSSPCILTFSSAWGTAPVCMSIVDTGAVAAPTPTTTTLSMAAGGLSPGNKIYYFCIGY